jgi:hypothetical protein
MYIAHVFNSLRTVIRKDCSRKFQLTGAAVHLLALVFRNIRARNNAIRHVTSHPVSKKGVHFQPSTFRAFRVS